MGVGIDWPATPDLLSLDDIVGRICDANGGASVCVTGPYVDSFGQYWYAFLEDNTRYRVEENGYVRNVQPYGRTHEPGFKPEEASG